MPVSNPLGWRQSGAMAFALQIEGIKYLFTDNSGLAWPTTGLPSGLTQLYGVLKREGFHIGSKINPKTGDLSQPDNIFKLEDAMISGSIRHIISDLFGRGVEGTTNTHLASSIAVGAGTFDVDAVFGSPPLDVWVNIEGMNVGTSDPDTFSVNTRAKYGSQEVNHTYDPVDEEDETDIIPLIPLVSDRPLSHYGRQVTLYWAELKADGTLDTAEIAWRGRLKGNVRTGAPVWEIPADSLWAALDTKILSRQRGTVWQDLVIPGGTTVSWVKPQVDPDLLPLGGSFVFPTTTTTYGSYAEFMAAFITALNADIDSEGASNVVVAAPMGDGTWRLDSTTSGLDVFFSSLSLGALFGVTSQLHIKADVDDGVDSYTEVVEPAGPVAARDSDGIFKLGLQFPANLTYWTPVEGEVDGVAYSVRSLVVIDTMEGKEAFELLSVDGSGFITIRQLFGYARRDIIVGANEGVDTQIRMGVLMEGDFVECWKAFIEATATVPYEIRPHVRTGDFNWTEIRDARPGGVICQRYRIVTEPTSFRALLEEDFAFCGMQPTIRSGKVSAISLTAPMIIDDALDIDEDVLRKGDLTRYEKSQQEVKNQMIVSFKRHRFGRDYEYKLPFNEPVSQALYDHTGTREIHMTGMQGYAVIATVAAELAMIASVYFALFSREYPILTLPCTQRAALRSPGDGCHVTDFVPINPATGTRSITDRLVLLLGVDFSVDTGKVEVEAIDIQDAAKRSGFAPVAKVTAYTLVGGVTHRLTLASGIYATAQAEGLYFATSWKVLLKEIDDGSPLADEAFTVQAVAADGLTIDIDAAPSGSMQTEITAGRVILTEDEYDTASQQLAAKQYLYVADDADNKLGTSGDDGYKLA